MKTSMKILAASVALAVSGVANAAIVTGQQAAGEMFLSVWDQVGQQSYALDLGVLQPDFVLNKAKVMSYDLSKDTNYSNFLNNKGLIYQIVSNDQWTVDYLSYGLISTTRDGIDTMSGIQNDPTLASSMAKVSDWVININGDAGDQRNPSLNLSARSVPGDMGYYNSTSWGANNGGMSFISAGAVGTSLDFVKYNLEQSDDFTVTRELLPNVWTLETNGMLTYAPVSAVPVPAAVWLFGSGLLGLASIARRRKA